MKMRFRSKENSYLSKITDIFTEMGQDLKLRFSNSSEKQVFSFIRWGQ